jgi:uncharacterized membrane protein YphA (DoxX/SURF4 family)
MRALAERILHAPAIRLAALLGLCAAYLQGGWNKLTDFGAAVAEMQHFGLTPAMPFAIAVIVTEFVGAALVLTGYARWFGALWLGGFTLVSTFVANRYWELAPGFERFMMANGFYEHLGLAGAFLFVAWVDLREQD